jgi:hypothetical protein
MTSGASLIYAAACGGGTTFPLVAPVRYSSILRASSMSKESREPLPQRRLRRPPAAPQRSRRHFSAFAGLKRKTTGRRFRFVER